MNELRQVKLTHEGLNQVTWVEDSPMLVPGNMIKLKGENNKWWNILEVYPYKVDKEDIPRSWHVGGL